MEITVLTIHTDGRETAERVEVEMDYFTGIQDKLPIELKRQPT